MLPFRIHKLTTNRHLVKLVGTHSSLQCRHYHQSLVRPLELANPHDGAGNIVLGFPSNNFDEQHTRWRSRHEITKRTEELYMRDQSARALLRSILREASYLPDEAARKYFTSLVLYQFRHDGRELVTISRGKASARASKLYARAEKGLQTLRSANAGDLRAMQTVLFMTYGRCGRRRHRLLTPLLESDLEPRERGLFETGLRPFNLPKEEISAMTLPSARAEALLKSQHAQQIPLVSGRNLKSIKLSIPLLNTWLKPMPRRRIRPAVRRQYRALMAKLHPPLGHEEWLRLRNLALGKTPWQGCPTRRSNGKVSQTSQHNQLAEQLIPVRLQKLGKNRVHAITARFMRRRWQEVFAMCPRMWKTVDTTADKPEDWTIEWGKSKDL